MQRNQSYMAQRATEPQRERFRPGAMKTPGRFIALTLFGALFVAMGILVIIDPDDASADSRVEIGG